MVRQNKTMSFDMEIYEYLKSVEPNASKYIEDLIYADMKRLDKLTKKEDVNIQELHQAAIIDIEARQKKEEEKSARSKAWESLDLEVREEIKDMESWGTKWKEIFYPLFVEKGSLTLKDVRDWYFANREGYKI